MNKIYLLLGSNINPEKNIPIALEYLKKIPGCMLLKTSGTWRTKPVGSCCTDFLNIAVLIETSLNPTTLKSHLAAVESAMGRVRTEDKNAPRVIDLDIVAINDRIIDAEVEVFDHLLLPLSEVAPDLILPGTKRTLAETSAERLKTTAAVRAE
mgnify:CR=1 FL=1